MKFFQKHLVVSSAMLLLLQIGCSKNPSSPMPTAGLVKISIRSINGNPASPLPKAAAAVNSVTITSARIVIDEIEFTSSIDDSADFELEDPFVQDLMIDTTSQVISTVQIPFGTYKEMEISIDQLSPNDGNAYAQNSDLQNLSIRIEGYLDGDTTNTFVFTSALSAEQEQEFNPPLVIDENSPSTNVVLAMDTSMWFVDRNNLPLDPTAAANQTAIERNIKASIRMYEDEDDDGEEDDDDDNDEDDDDE
ncbi:hypothetical protein KC734_12500 [candidate division KSB1 bacterium]|nr:hypothetical protein [candidate division KSB1 bacterium]